MHHSLICRIFGPLLGFIVLLERRRHALGARPLRRPATGAAH